MFSLSGETAASKYHFLTRRSRCCCCCCRYRTPSPPGSKVFTIFWSKERGGEKPGRKRTRTLTHTPPVVERENPLPGAGGCRRVGNVSARQFFTFTTATLAWGMPLGWNRFRLGFKALTFGHLLVDSRYWKTICIRYERDGNLGHGIDK